MLALEVWFVFLARIALPVILLKVAPEHHRFAVFVDGKYLGLRGPGILIRMPALGAKWLRLRIGDKVDVISPNLAKVGNYHFPVIGEPGGEGTAMRIKSFQRDSIVIGAE